MSARPLSRKERRDNFAVLPSTGKETRQNESPFEFETVPYRNGSGSKYPQTSSESLDADIGVERHYSVAELAKLWGLSTRTIRRIFENEPGVLLWGNSETRFKRSYVTLRIPETVVLRVHRQLCIAR